MTITWIKSAPQKHGNLVVLRYRHKDEKKIHQGLFSWNDMENAFIQCIEGPDGFALYQEEGWRVISWKPYKSEK